MLTDDEFQLWCGKHGLSDEAITAIQDIRKSPPVRKVGGGKRNEPGTYPSTKMGVSIQFESRTLEFCGIHLMEHDESVLEYYDQPSIMKIRYQSDDRLRGHTYTPDFFVITTDRAEWVEWKFEEELLKLEEKNPNRYFRDENGVWRCPPAEQYAAQYGLGFRICSSKILNRIFLRNIRFLEHYLLDTFTRSTNEATKKIVDIVSSSPGISVRSLLNKADGFNADDVYELIANEKIYFDIYQQVLAIPEDTNLYIDSPTSKACQYLHSCEINSDDVRNLEINMGTRIVWNNQPWTIVDVNDTTITLVNTTQATSLPISYFMEMVSDGKILVPKQKKTIEKESSKIHQAILEASAEDLEAANRRFEILQMHQRGIDSGVSERTIRDWARKYRTAEEIYGNGYLGLLTHDKKKGNRNRKLPEKSLILMSEVISEFYETLKQRKVIECWGILDVKCREASVPTPSLQSFYQEIRRLPEYETTYRRQGPRAAYTYEPIHWFLDRNIPRHGDRAFEVVHIDHTELDIQTKSRRGIKLGKPWVTFVVDAFTRRVLAFYLTYEKPSYRSCMMAIREMVRRYSRRPDIIVVDNGKEFKSVYFDTLVNLYKITNLHRPPHKSRVGSVCERLFGTTNTQFIDNLWANTQIMKGNVRHVTKTVNPRNNAIWTLIELYENLSRYLYEEYVTEIHSSLGRSPRDEFAYSIAESGNRPQAMIPYNEAFRFSTLPGTRKGTAMVDSRDGIKINYINYWHSELRSSKLHRQQVYVRFDPWDAGVAYAFLNGRWTELKSEYDIFAGKSVKEIQLAAEEIRRRHSLQGINLVINAKQIAEFLLQVEQQEDWMLIRERAVENKKIIQMMEGTLEYSIDYVNDGCHLVYSEENSNESNEERKQFQTVAINDWDLDQYEEM